MFTRNVSCTKIGYPARRLCRAVGEMRWCNPKGAKLMSGKLTVFAIAATLSVPAVLLLDADARAFGGYYGYAPGFVHAPSYAYASYRSYGGRTYDYYRRDFQLQGRNGQ
jgi:hypothetical protein